jgi:anti-anti-sigma factor
MSAAEAHEVATRLPVVVHRRDTITVISVEGELDEWTVAALCDRVEAVIEDGAPSLLIDLSALHLCEERAVRALAGCVHEAVTRQARVRVLAPCLPDVAEAFAAADTLDPLPVASDAEQALHDLG